MAWIYLILAIFCELIATTLLKISDGWTKLIPVIGMVIFYVLCFWIFALALKKIELGVAYAIWSAVGIVVLATIGIVFFKESVSPVKMVSILLIIIGVVGLNLSSVSH